MFEIFLFAAGFAFGYFGCKAISNSVTVTEQSSPAKDGSFTTKVTRTLI